MSNYSLLCAERTVFDVNFKHKRVWEEISRRMAKKATVQHWCNVARNGRSWRRALWNGRQLEGSGKRSYNMTVLRIAGSILVFKAGVNPRTTASSSGIAQVSGVSVGKWKRKAKRGDSEGRETPFVSLFPPSSSPPPPLFSTKSPLPQPPKKAWYLTNLPKKRRNESSVKSGARGKKS